MLGWLFGGSFSGPIDIRSRSGERGYEYLVDVVGEASYHKEIWSCFPGVTRGGVKHEKIDTLVSHDAGNVHDDNAMKVEIKGRLVGYLPRERAAALRRYLLKEKALGVLCRASVVGGWVMGNGGRADFGIKLALPVDWVGG